MILKELRKKLDTVLERTVQQPKTGGTVWIEKAKYMNEERQHKVRVHTKDGHSEVRYVSDGELELLHKEPHVTKVVNVI